MATSKIPYERPLYAMHLGETLFICLDDFCFYPEKGLLLLYKESFAQSEKDEYHEFEDYSEKCIISITRTSRKNRAQSFELDIEMIRSLSHDFTIMPYEEGEGEKHFKDFYFIFDISFLLLSDKEKMEIYRADKNINEKIKSMKIAELEEMEHVSVVCEDYSLAICVRDELKRRKFFTKPKHELLIAANLPLALKKYSTLYLIEIKAYNRHNATPRAQKIYRIVSQELSQRRKSYFEK